MLPAAQNISLCSAEAQEHRYDVGTKNVASQPTPFSHGMSLFPRLTPCILSQKLILRGAG